MLPQGHEMPAVETSQNSHLYLSCYRKGVKLPAVEDSQRVRFGL